MIRDIEITDKEVYEHYLYEELQKIDIKMMFLRAILNKEKE